LPENIASNGGEAPERTNECAGTRYTFTHISFVKCDFKFKI
jgi:hypothetical protein